MPHLSLPLFCNTDAAAIAELFSLARLKSAHQKPTLDEPKRMKHRFRNCACAVSCAFFPLLVFFFVYSVDFISLSICVQIENALVDGLPFLNALLLYSLLMGSLYFMPQTQIVALAGTVPIKNSRSPSFTRFFSSFFSFYFILFLFCEQREKKLSRFNK